MKDHSAFQSEGRLDRPLLTLFIAIHTILLFNAIAHEPRIGYDAMNHLKYIEAFSSLNLPTVDQTTEFFSPPLPYLFPALLRHFGLDLWSSAKAAQLFNVFYSVILGVFLLKICDEVRPGDRRLKLLSLVLLGMLPVYYRSFALVRGEPLLAALSVFVAHRMLRLARSGGATRQNCLLLGLGIGMMILSRQWGFFLLPALVVFVCLRLWRMEEGRGKLVRAVAAALLIGAVTGGWFYGILLMRYGSVTAFNRNDRTELSLANQPAEFYFGLGGGALFSRPVRPAFPNQLMPMLYADVWGDYWCYFDIFAIDTTAGLLHSGPALARALEDTAIRPSLKTNFESMSRYLGRVNLISLLPSALLIVGVISGGVVTLGQLRGGASSPSVALTFLFVLFTTLGYFWFLLSFLSPDKGEAIKGTYILQVFPFVCILGGEQFVRIREHSPRTARVGMWLLALCALHNFPILFTRMTTLY